MKMLRRSRIGGAAFCLNCRGKKSNWGKLRGKTHCGEVQSQLFLAELEIIERKKDRKLNISSLFLWQREKDSNPHIRSQSPLCYHYTIPLCSLDEHLLLYQRFCICQELIANFPDFFHFGAAGCFWPAFQRRRYADGAGGKAACARSGGRPERGLAVSAEGKSANFTDLVKMPIPFCALSCYTAYIKASERSTDYDRNEPQC